MKCGVDYSRPVYATDSSGVPASASIRISRYGLFKNYLSLVFVSSWGRLGFDEDAEPYGACRVVGPVKS